jgi:hypothetical protein
MNRMLCILSVTPLLIAGAALAADTQPSGDLPIPGREAGQPTSDRTPGKITNTPLSQTGKFEGATSDRTPSSHVQSENAGAGEPPKK